MQKAECVDANIGILVTRKEIMDQLGLWEKIRGS